MLTKSPPQTQRRFSPGRTLWRSLNLLVAPDRLPLTIILLGVLFRVGQYLFNRSLWIDEASIALIIKERSFGQLFEPLNYNQAAPIGFLLLVKTATILFGYNELALRLTPLLCGVASLPLFYLVARRLVRPGAVPIALALFAVADSLIYYSSELKQYSGDATVAVLLYQATYLPLAKTNSFTFLKLLGTGAAGAILLWFSHPSIFILAGIGMVLFLKNALARNWRKVALLLIPGIFWLVSFAIFYVVSLQAATSNQGLLDFHEVFFMPMPPLTPANLTWLATNFFFIFQNPGSTGLAGLGALCFIIGGFAYYKKQTSNFWALVLPILFALAASGFHKYSFDGRLLLFLLPALYLLIGEGVAEVREVTRKVSPVIGLALVVLLLALPVASAFIGVGAPRTKEELRPVLAYYQANRQPDDLLYVYYGAGSAFQYYQDTLGLGQNCCIMGVGSRDDWSQYARDLDKLKGKSRVWVVLSHVVNNEETFFKYYLDQTGKELDALQTPGSMIYLYDLSGK
ncbi:MAG: hypothetical protein J0I20_15480 [Chloroflexi bacterium]|mgnify:CR=1 FL=1|nr:hypothetical protein [Chloroflexota bacterium]OJV91293.1 MAG: hypothetical protein BGO39_26980 [Chloroflexi bacterium 54-19]